MGTYHYMYQQLANTEKQIKDLKKQQETKYKIMYKFLQERCEIYEGLFAPLADAFEDFNESLYRFIHPDGLDYNEFGSGGLICLPALSDVSSDDSMPYPVTSFTTISTLQPCGCEQFTTVEAHIPTRYLVDNGLDTMRTDADSVRDRLLVLQTQKDEKIRQSELEEYKRLRAKFGS